MDIGEIKEAQSEEEVKNVKKIKEKLEPIFDIIKHVNWRESHLTFYVIKRGNLIKRKVKYTAHSVEIDDKLAEKFKNIVNIKIKEARNFEYYDFNTADLDGDLLALPIEGTDLENIIPKLRARKIHDDVKRIEDIMDAKIYVIRLDFGDIEPLFCFRYIRNSWAARNIRSGDKIIFKDRKLVSIDEKEIFKIDEKIDFIVYDDAVFIDDKRNFEVALNFRERFIAERDMMLESFLINNIDIFDDVDIVKKHIGDNMRYLRKLMQIKESGYYKDENFIIKLKKINEEKDWGLEYTADDKIITTEENIFDVLRTLNNDRLLSLLTDSEYFSDVKKEVEEN